MKIEKQNDGKKGILVSFYNAFKSFGTSLPMLFGVILAIGLFQTYVSSRVFREVFTGELLLDTVMGSIMGSISAGNAVTSYIIGGELIKEDVSLIAVTAFIVAWVTVGIIQLPAEAAILGRRFAWLRNILAFVFSVLVAIATVKTLMVV